MDDLLLDNISIRKFVYPDPVVKGGYACCLIFGSSHHQQLLASKAARLYHKGICNKFIVSGYASQASDIRSTMIELGVSGDVIALEPLASNTLENVIFSKQFILNCLRPVEQRMIIVCKNYAARRCLLSVQKHIAVKDIAVESIDIHSIDINNIFLCKLFVEKMLSEVEKIILYSQRGDICEYPAQGKSDIKLIYATLLKNYTANKSTW